MSSGGPPFRMGSLDHVHVRVPDRAEAARWYAEHLGFEPVAAFAFWAEGFEGGPLQISADGGRTTLALFEATESGPMLPLAQGVAFSVDAETFVAFARSLPCGIDHTDGVQLERGHLVDFDLCVAYEFSDPWGNRFELNCYDHEAVRAALVDVDGVEAERKWPDGLHRAWLDGGTG